MNHHMPANKTMMAINVPQTVASLNGVSVTTYYFMPPKQPSQGVGSSHTVPKPVSLDTYTRLSETLALVVDHSLDIQTEFASQY